MLSGLAGMKCAFKPAEVRAAGLCVQPDRLDVISDVRRPLPSTHMPSLILSN